MPIYEFYSPKTNKIYSFFARSMSMRDKTPKCPDDKRASMVKLVSGFAITGKAERDKPEGDGIHDDEEFDLSNPKVAAAMQEMEHAMASMDENNPDPKVLGSLMRKMADISGEKMPEQLTEMVARLEKGEDPEKLEAEYGDALESLDQEMGPDEKEANPEGRLSRLLRRRALPQRDPTLYEMAEYL